MPERYLIDKLVVFIDDKEVDIDTLAVDYIFPQGSYVYAVESDNPTSHDLVKKDISNKRYEGVVKAGMVIRNFDGEETSKFHTLHLSSVRNSD